MCGRYLLHAPVDLLQRAFGFAELPNLAPRYNIAPTQAAPIVRIAEGARSLVMARWGLIPFWAKDPRIGVQAINARAETVATKPMFREAFRRRRCLVPADGFYEWQRLDARSKRPLLIRPADGQPIAFAGLWEVWRGPEGPVTSYTIVTTTANATCAPIHDRMPVILAREDHAAWLDPTRPDAERLLRPCPDAWLTVQAVSPRVGNVRNDDPELIEPV
jgi:putative SOS response-associated peptidase YedK